MKEKAAACHRSQHALMMRNKNVETLREALRTVEAYHRYLPPVEPGDSPRDTFAEILRAAGAWQPQHTDNA